MSTFRKIALPALAAASVFGMAGTASAQHSGDHGYYQQNARYDRDDRHDYRGRIDGRTEAIRKQLAQLEQRVNRNDVRDRISEREASRLRREIRDVRQQFHVYARNGLDNREFRTLENRINRIRDRLQMDRRDGNRW